MFVFFFFWFFFDITAACKMVRKKSLSQSLVSGRCPWHSFIPQWGWTRCAGKHDIIITDRHFQINHLRSPFALFFLNRSLGHWEHFWLYIAAITGCRNPTSFLMFAGLWILKTNTKKKNLSPLWHFCQTWPSVFNETVALVYFAYLSTFAVINLSFKHLLHPGVSHIFQQVQHLRCFLICQETIFRWKHCVLWL